MFTNKLINIHIKQHNYQTNQTLQKKIYILKQNIHPHIKIKNNIQPNS